MELQAQSSLNLQVTKDDLIDILIDEQLTILENRVKKLSEEREKYQNSNELIHIKKRTVLETKLRKLCPIPAKKEDFTISYSANHTSSGLMFKFKSFVITLNGTFDCTLKFTPFEEDLKKSNNKEISELNADIWELNEEIKTLNGNNKRIKAKMLRTFLTTTEEGKSILKTLGNTPKQALIGYGK